MKNDINKAIELLNEGNYTCVLCKGDILYTSTQRGVKPLLDWLDEKVDLKGFSAADRVVGKGAAFLYVLLGVKAVYAHVMSDEAIQILTENGIKQKCDVSVKNIINRAGTGICPMEKATREISNPKKALQAIKQRLAELKSRA